MDFVQDSACKLSLQHKSPAESKQRQLSSVVGLIAERKHAEASQLLHSVLPESPNDPDLLYPLATCQRQLGELKHALETPAHLEELRPNFAGVFLERGRTLLAMGRPEDALAIFEKCVRINPTYLGGWLGLLNLAGSLGRSDRHSQAREQLHYFESLDQALVQVLRAFHDGETFKAERMCRSYLKEHPKNVEAMCVLARIGSEIGILDDAEFILESACEFEPQNSRARLQYIDVLHKRQNYAKALEHARQLVRSQPKSLLFRLAYANQLMAIGDVDGALNVYNRILDQPEDNLLANPRLFLTRGHARKTIGQVEGAVLDYRMAYEMRSDFGDSYWSLANLKTYRFTPEELRQMHGFVDSTRTSVEDRVHLSFAVGKAYEDQEDFRVPSSFTSGATSSTSSESAMTPRKCRRG